jgi:hypothetical protein
LATHQRARSGGFDLIGQVGATLKHLEQFHQGQRGLGLAGFVTREGIDATAEDFGGFALAALTCLLNASLKVSAGRSSQVPPRASTSLSNGTVRLKLAPPLPLCRAR